MRVLINSRPLWERKAGIGYYVQNLIGQLEKKDLDLVYSHLHEGAVIASRIKVISKRLKNYMGSFYPKPLAAMIYNCFMHKYDILDSKSMGIEKSFDIYHETSHCVLPNIFDKVKINNFIADIHDLSPIRYPELHLDSLVKKVRKTLDQLLSADLFITKSQFIRYEVADYFGISVDRIEVVPNAPSFNYRFLGRQREEVRTELCRQLAGFPDRPFILYTGTIEPRKNLDTLIRAFARSRYHTEFVLVLAGGFGWKYETLKRLPQELGISKQVLFLGYQPSDVFELLYNAAEVFVYPSLYEGFGMPNVEAMQCGTPIVTSNASCLPEVVGDAALLFDPMQPDDLTAQMEQLIESDDLKKDLRQKGLLRAAQYSWDLIGEQVFQIYRKVAS
jgi:glycosyltransferase involved in cell wall biosynthesis